MGDLVGFGLLVGHLVGDFLFQNDLLAKNKSNPHPGREPHPGRIWLRATRDERGYLLGEEPPIGELQQQRAWWVACSRYRFGHLVCAIHCLLYTLAVWLFSCWWMPWWGLVICFLAHFPVDRWRLARVLMHYNYQEEFATGPLAPWSAIVVDQAIHLVVLFLIALAARL